MQIILSSLSYLLSTCFQFFALAPTLYTLLPSNYYTMLTVAFILCALQALAIASPISQEQGGTSIALSKRQFDILSGAPLDPDVLESLLGFVEA